MECTDYFADTPFRVFQAPYVGAVVMPGGASQPRKTLDAWQDWAKQRGAKGLAYVLVGDDGELGGPVAKNLSDSERAGLAERVGAAPGDCVFFAAGEPSPSRALLGAARLEVGRRCGLIDDSAWSFVWIVDAPLFEASSAATASGDVAVGTGAWTAVHHAFTSPKPEWIDSFESDPANALAYGPPPHGGIAFGWDRICALLSGMDSIREVIAFPKTGGGFDPLTAAPAPITAAQRAEAGVDGPPAKATSQAE